MRQVQESDIERVGIDVDRRHGPSLATICGLQAARASLSQDEGVAKGRIGRVQDDFG